MDCEKELCCMLWLSFGVSVSVFVVVVSFCDQSRNNKNRSACGDLTFWPARINHDLGAGHLSKETDYRMTDVQAESMNGIELL